MSGRMLFGLIGINISQSLAPALHAETLERVLRRTWVLGLGDVPPGVVPYLVHPWVVANDALKAHGWQPLAIRR